MNFNINFKYKRTKLITGLLFSFWMVPLTVYGGLQIVSPELCAVCHMMKPEYYTWQVSSHGKAKVKCLSCHIPPGPINFMKYNILGLKNVYSAAVDNYVTPIKMIRPTPDSACEKCHELKEVDKSSKQKITAAHRKHKNQGVHCARCHRGVAHGNIADRKVTYEGDYQKWDRSLGESLMSDIRFVRPDMDTCMRCHQLRNVTKECKACHTGGKRPADHNSDDFTNKSHGPLARRDLQYCDSCHGYMSEKPPEVLKERHKYKEFLDQGKPPKEASPVIPYTRENTYCKKCHGKRPLSHNRTDYIQSHGLLAAKDKNRCEVCHDNYIARGPGGTTVTQTGGGAVTLTACGDCHPSSHYDSVQWKNGYHPVPLPNPRKITKSCYVCHLEKACSRCHGLLE